MAIKDFDPKILIVRSKKVNAEALEAGAGLSVVIRAGAGIDTIDVGAASRLGVFVTNCPGKKSIAVAELVMGLILSLDRRIADQVSDLRQGRWNKAEYGKARGLHGRTLGIVGLGQIGREIAVRAQAFGMRVVAWSRQLTTRDATRLAIGYCQTPLEVAQQSDIVTINVAATAETRKLVNRDFLTAMHPGAFLINTSRGTVVDEEALADDPLQEHPGRARRLRERGSPSTASPKASWGSSRPSSTWVPCGNATWGRSSSSAGPA